MSMSSQSWSKATLHLPEDTTDINFDPIDFSCNSVKMKMLMRHLTKHWAN